MANLSKKLDYSSISAQAFLTSFPVPALSNKSATTTTPRYAFVGPSSPEKKLGSSQELQKLYSRAALKSYNILLTNHPLPKAHHPPPKYSPGTPIQRYLHRHIPARRSSGRLHNLHPPTSPSPNPRSHVSPHKILRPRNTSPQKNRGNFNPVMLAVKYSHIFDNIHAFLDGTGGIGRVC